MKIRGEENLNEHVQAFFFTKFFKNSIADFYKNSAKIAKTQKYEIFRWAKFHMIIFKKLKPLSLLVFLANSATFDEFMHVFSNSTSQTNSFLCFCSKISLFWSTIFHKLRNFCRHAKSSLCTLCIKEHSVWKWSQKCHFALKMRFKGRWGGGVVFVGWGASGGVFRVWGVEAGIGKGVWGRGEWKSVWGWGVWECVGALYVHEMVIWGRGTHSALLSGYLGQSGHPSY